MVVQGCRVEFVDKPPCNIIPKQYPVCSSLSNQMSVEIKSMLRRGIIREFNPVETMFLSPVFARIKKSGSLRIILDLKELNQHVPYKHFKMEMFEQALKLVQPNMWMCSLDIKDAYYSIPIHENDQKFFAFVWDGVTYVYTVMPNGWAQAPYIFTKLLKPAFYHLRAKGLLSSYFIDDSLLLAELYQRCIENRNETKQLLIRLGFTINEAKSILEPTQCILHLGNVIDSVRMIVYLPDDKKAKVKSLCEKLASALKETIRFVAKVIGTLISTFSAVEFGKLYYRQLEWGKIEALKREKGNFNAKMEITDAMKGELQWWIINIDSQVRTIVKPIPCIVMYTDSSKIGWGCKIADESFNGNWTIPEQNLHINILETKAIYLSLLALGGISPGTHIRVLSDSTTAVAYVNNMGGINSKECNAIAKDIWDIIVKANAWLSCQHVPGEENSADAPSRKFHDDLEWQISEQIFKAITTKWGEPSIDLFATRTNCKIDVFCSWRKDPMAAFIDAFSLDWSKFALLYMFPPFSVIGKCLQKISQDNGEAILIAPFWPQQVWFPNLLRLLSDHPIILPSTEKILSLAHSDAKHPLSPKLKLIACRVSGNSSNSKDFRMRLSTSSYHPGDPLRNRDMPHISRNGTGFAVDGISIPFYHL